MAPYVVSEIFAVLFPLAMLLGGIGLALSIVLLPFGVSLFGHGKILKGLALTFSLPLTSLFLPAIGPMLVLISLFSWVVALIFALIAIHMRRRTAVVTAA